MNTPPRDATPDPDLGWLRDRRIAIRSDDGLAEFDAELSRIVDELYEVGQGGVLLAQLHEISGDARRDLIDLDLHVQYLSHARVDSAGASQVGNGELARLQKDAISAKQALDTAPDVRSLQRALVEAEKVRLRGFRAIPESGQWSL